MRLLLAFVLFLAGLALTPLLLMLYINYGRPPVSVVDSPFPFEKTIVRAALHHRIDREAQDSPISLTTENQLAGALLYREHCAFCHGLPGEASGAGTNMYPKAPQLWTSHRKGIVGVSDDPVGETFWKLQNGIRLTGMPSYRNLLNDQQMWQVSLLLSKANEPLTEDVRNVLRNKQ